MKKESINKLFDLMPHQQDDIETVGIVYNDDEAVAGATVHIFDGNKLMFTTKSDEYGRFTVALPRNKKYAFDVSKENFKAEHQNFDPSNAKFEDHLYLDFQMEKLAPVAAKTGKMHFIGTVSSDGKSLAGVVAKMFLEGDKYADVVTDENGHFELDINPTDLYTLILKKENY